MEESIDKFADLWRAAINAKKIFLVDRLGDYCVVDIRTLDEMIDVSKKRKTFLPAMWKAKEETLTIMLENKSGFFIRNGKLADFPGLTVPYPIVDKRDML